MAKRFTDTDKWKKSFIKGLSTVHKLFFFYILDDCNHAGIWHVEPEIASIRIGEEINIDEVKKELGKHIVEFDKGEKWFIPYFITFQYGALNKKVNVHKSVIDILAKYKLKQFINPSQGVMDKDKDMDMDKDMEERREKFKKECESFNLIHTKEMINQFFEYWTELNKLKTKMKFELQQTFETSKRLTTWKNNNFGNKQTSNQSKIINLADGIID